MCKQILLITGLHPNESCAAIVGRQIFEEIQERGCAAELLEMPRPLTLLGNLDNEDGADPRYCIVDSTGELDVDLEPFVGDEAIHNRYPGRTPIEFHNYSDDLRIEKLVVEPGIPPEQLRFGDIGPGNAGRYELGFWRNAPGGGVPGKYCIETPAVFKAVDYERLEARFRKLRSWRQQGHDFPTDRKLWMLNTYVLQEADPEESRSKGYLSDAIVEKITAWILLVLDLPDRFQ
jgi:hypothetical protein